MSRDANCIPILEIHGGAASRKNLASKKCMQLTLSDFYPFVVAYARHVNRCC